MYGDNSQPAANPEQMSNKGFSIFFLSSSFVLSFSVLSLNAITALAHKPLNPVSNKNMFKHVVCCGNDCSGNPFAVMPHTAKDCSGKRVCHPKNNYLTARKSCITLYILYTDAQITLY